MARRDVILYPEDPLTTKAEPYEEIGPEVQRLATDLIETMNAYEGVGLAGPQVGVSKRIFVMCEPEGQPRCFINPKIIARDGNEEAEEGCLSMPGVYAPVNRAQRVKVEGYDEYGEPVAFEAGGLPARIVQHEIDHLDGIMFIDRLDILTREDKLREWDHVRAEMRQAAQRS